MKLQICFIVVFASLSTQLQAMDCGGIAAIKQQIHGNSSEKYYSQNYKQNSNTQNKQISPLQKKCQSN